VQRSPRSRLTSIGVFLALGAVSSACVHPDPPSVGMSKVEASLVFGVTDVPQPVETPVQQVIAQVFAATVVEDEPQAEEAAPNFEFQKPKVPILRSDTAAKPACPTAPITAAAEVAPQPRISGGVPIGTSKWRIQGYYTAPSVDPAQEASRAEVEDTAAAPRSVRNLKQINATTYSFEVVTPPRKALSDGGKFLTVTTYEVNTAGISANPSDGVGTVATPGFGEPERGITIARIDSVDPDTGQRMESFVPTVGLLVLPLPAVAGDSFSTTAIDPQTGQTISRDSVVVGRERVDACGDLVDGWLVESKERSTFGRSVVDAAPSLTVEIDVASIFATQYGGVPIFEKYAFAGPCDLCPMELRERLGQLNPDPPTAS
jgi:hypothetical protein